MRYRRVSVAEWKEYLKHAPRSFGLAHAKPPGYRGLDLRWHPGEHIDRAPPKDRAWMRDLVFGEE